MSKRYKILRNEVISRFYENIKRCKSLQFSADANCYDALFEFCAVISFGEIEAIEEDEGSVGLKQFLHKIRFLSMGFKNAEILD